MHRRADAGGDRRRRAAGGDPDPSLQSHGASLTSKLLPDGRLVAEEATQPSEVDMDQAGPGLFHSRGDGQARFQQVNGSHEPTADGLRGSVQGRKLHRSPQEKIRRPEPAGRIVYQPGVARGCAREFIR